MSEENCASRSTRRDRGMNRGRTATWIFVSILFVFAIPAIAATPTSGTISSSATSVAWNGFPGPAYSDDATNPLGSSTADAGCTDGTNCDVFTLKIVPGDYTGKRIR